jgi:hypothetical protein
VHGTRVGRTSRLDLKGRGGPTAALEVLLLGIASAAFYLLLYLAERRIFLNGWPAASGGSAPDNALVASDLLLYLVATIGLFGVYARLLFFFSLRRGLLVGRARAVALLFPVVFNFAWWLTQPFLSRDVLSYLAQGYLGTLPDGNPHVQAVTSAIDGAFGAQLTLFGWIPTNLITPYGPLWTHVEIGVVRLTEDVGSAVLLIKGSVVLASLGSAGLIWMILGRLRPADQFLGTLAYLANPLMVIEFAGEGHNDALMLLFLLAGLLLSVARRPAAASVSLLLGALTKYLPLIFLPAQLVYAWRTRRSSPRLAVSLGLAGITGLIVTGLAYASFWRGLATFNGVTSAGERTVQSSTSGALLWVLERWLSPTLAAQITSVILISIFGLILMAAVLSIRDAESLVRSCAVIALAYLFVASPYVWPWHAALPVALMALSPDRRFLVMIFVLSLCARLVSPLNDLTTNGFIPYQFEAVVTTLVLIGIPLVVVVAFSRSRRRAMLWTRGSPMKA